MTMASIFQPRTLQVTQAPRFETGQTFTDPYAHGAPQGLMVHRTDPASDEQFDFTDSSPASVRDYYAKLVPGLRMPFAIHVAPDGVVTQCVALGLQTPHAASANKSHIGIGLMGDFRRKEGTAIGPAQLGALVGVCASLVQSGLIDPRHPEWLVSHDGHPAWSKMKQLESPGALLPMRELRDLVIEQLASHPPVKGLDFAVDAEGTTTTEALRRRCFPSEDVQQAVDRAKKLRNGKYFDSALAALDVDLSKASNLDQSEIALWRGKIHQFRGDHTTAAADLDHAAHVAQAVEHPAARLRQLAYVMFQRAMNAEAAKDVQADHAFDQAEPYLQGVANDLRYPALERSDMLHNLAYLCDRRGDVKQAIQQYQALVPLRQASGGGQPLGYTYARLGDALCRIGRHDEGIDRLQQGIELIDASGPATMADKYRAQLTAYLDKVQCSDKRSLVAQS